MVSLLGYFVADNHLSQKGGWRVDTPPSGHRVCRENHSFLGFLDLLLRGVGAFLRAWQATTPTIVLFLVGHLYHDLSIGADLTYIRIL